MEADIHNSLQHRYMGHTSLQLAYAMTVFWPTCGLESAPNCVFKPPGKQVL